MGEREASTDDGITKVMKGVIRTAMSLGLTPEEVGEVFTDLDEGTLNSLAYLFSGWGDGAIVRFASQKVKGGSLKEESKK